MAFAVNLALTILCLLPFFPIALQNCVPDDHNERGSTALLPTILTIAITLWRSSRQSRSARRLLLMGVAANAEYGYGALSFPINRRLKDVRRFYSSARLAIAMTGTRPCPYRITRESLLPTSF